jgi:hypothetical protein
MDWENIITVFAVIATNLATVIILYCHQDNKMTTMLNAMRLEMSELSNGIRAEMRDFHGRLCAIEERNKGK